MSLLFNCYNFTHVAGQGLDPMMFVFRSLLSSQPLRYLSEVQPRNCTVLSTVFIVEQQYYALGNSLQSFAVVLSMSSS